MTSARLSPWQVLLRTALICGMLSALILGLSLKRVDPLPLSNAPLRFEHQRAFDAMKGLSKGFPNRVTWSNQRRKATQWLKQQLASMGYQPQGMLFSEVIAGKQYSDLENVWAEKRGSVHPDEIMVVMAHYDVAENTSEGAMDDASGVGVVLELARIFAQEKTDRTILFLLTDSEEFGAFWGARAFARQYPRAEKIIAAASFDFVAPEKQTTILTLCDGLKGGFTPLWLRELALSSLRSLNLVKVLDFTNFMEFVERAIGIPPADHGALLAAGIPSFNWVGQTDNFAYEMAHYHHTQHDVVEALRPESFEPFGKGAERLLRSIDALPRIPVDFRDSAYWKITSRHYLEGWAVTFLHILAFIPFLTYGITKFGVVFRRRSRDRVLEVARHEAKMIGILLGSLLLGYVVILLLPALRIITQYETFPATQKSLLLSTPNFLAILLVLGAVVGVNWTFRRVFSESPPPGATGASEADYADVRHALHAALLTIVIVLAFLKNTFLGTLLLLPPAYLWTALRMRQRTRGKDRWLNMMLLLGGSLTFVAILLIMATVYHVGVFYWYVFLAAAYGLISAYSVILFFMALTVMIRLFRAFVIYK